MMNIARKLTGTLLIIKGLLFVGGNSELVLRQWWSFGKGDARIVAFLGFGLCIAGYGVFRKKQLAIPIAALAELIEMGVWFVWVFVLVGKAQDLHRPIAGPGDFTNAVFWAGEISCVVLFILIVYVAAELS